MHAAEPWALVATMFDPQTVRWTVWGGLVLLTVSLLVLMRTRWGQSNPLGKCVVLSLLAHLLLGIYTTTVHIVTGGASGGDGPPLRVSFVGPGNERDADTNPADSRPWDAPPDRPIAELADKVPASLSDPSGPPAGLDPEVADRAPAAGALPGELSGAPPVRISPADSPIAKIAAAIDAPAATRVEPAGQTGPDQAAAAAAPQIVEVEPALEPMASPFDPAALAGDSANSAPAASVAARGQPALIAGPDPFAAAAGGNTTARPGGSERLAPAAIPHGTGPGWSGGPGGDVTGPTDVSPLPIARAAGGAADQVPSIYQLRMAPDHTRQALAHGGTRDTEAAVKAALAWLAAHQSADGRWDGKRLEAGRDAAIDGHERRGAGSRADTGITGLALLAFLASGHTQHDGEHSDTVRRGLNYLLGAQAPDGNLGGNATLYEKMYCHAMATFALSEAYAMTHDVQLQTAVRRAIGFTLVAQHGGGGWRYQAGEPGDTSQLGWQFMALKSAELAGIPMPAETRDGMIRFLKSVSSGRHNGLASYRPGHGVSRTMTAEALVCRQFLGMARANPASDEAGQYLLEELPGQRQANFYYWYYATLSLYQLQGEAWERWNQALQTTLVGSQRTAGDLAGSWDPDPIWGAYGGRAYSTALGALCLEVYYRFLPFYIEAAGRDPQRK